MATEIHEEKYRNAILYFIQHISNGTIGKVKLMKLLYYLDFDHFEQYGTSVTGDVYRHLPMGPVPVHAQAVLDRMVADRHVQVIDQPLGLPHPQKRYLPLRHYSVQVFSSSEVAILCNVAEKWEHHSGRDIIHAVHGDPPWLMTDENSLIDYRLVAFRSRAGGEGFSEGDGEEPAVALTAEDRLLHEEGLALVKRLEMLARQDTGFSNWLQVGIDDIEAGRWVLFDEDGWQDKP